MSDISAITRLTSGLSQGISLPEEPAPIEIQDPVDYLGLHSLYPVHRVALKMVYGIPLNTVPSEIVIHDAFNEKVLYRFSEREYADYLYTMGRVNRRHDEGPVRQAVLVWGRRSGKSTLAAEVMTYETYLLLKTGDPAQFFRQSPQTKVCLYGMDCLSSTRMQERYLDALGKHEEYDMVSSGNHNCTYLSSAEGRQDIKVMFMTYSDVTKSIRGSCTKLLAMDEVAWSEKAQGTYEAVNQTVAATSGVGLSILMTTSRNPANPWFNDFCKQYMTCRGHTLVLTAPTWEIDQYLSSSYLHDAHKQYGTEAFLNEFGSGFGITEGIPD